MRVETRASVIPTRALEPGSASFHAQDREVPAATALAGFFEALAALDSGESEKPVTILHLGDQHIAANRITSQLRSRLQTRFGDAGRGFMAPGAFWVAGAEIERFGDWQIATGTEASDTGPFGLSGVRMRGRDGATVKITTLGEVFDWAEITFAAGPKKVKAYVAVDDSGDVVSTDTAEPTWQLIKINASGSTLTVRAESKAPVDLLSWRIVGEQAGVRYINIGLPKARMDTPIQWNKNFMTADLEHLSPDLIIIGYGTNAAFNDKLDTNDYEQAAERLIDKLRDAAPGASSLITGPPNLARAAPYARRDSAEACRPLTTEEPLNHATLLRAENRRSPRWHPPLKLEVVKHVLNGMASRKHAFFWSWSKLMGGPCIIHA
jgi:hypothetical protein